MVTNSHPTNDLAAAAQGWTATLAADATSDGYSTSELWQTFQAELARYASALRQHWQQLTANPKSPVPRVELQRIAHTLKGTAGMMGFTHVAQLAEQLEEALNDSPTNPNLSEMIRVLEELSGNRRDTVALQTPVQTKAFADLSERLHQTVNHAAQVSGKQVQFVVEDAGVELKPDLYDDVAEILLHLLRNAVEHGIEPPAQRAMYDKPDTGSILVTASYEHTRLVVQVIDDGRGIDPDAIRQTAIAHGQLTPEGAARLSAEQLYDLLLQPGFTTAREVTELAGRGMGLDVVNHRVTQRRGTFLIESELHRGTCVVLCFPTRREH